MMQNDIMSEYVDRKGVLCDDAFPHGVGRFCIEQPLVFLLQHLGVHINLAINESTTSNVTARTFEIAYGKCDMRNYRRECTPGYAYGEARRHIVIITILFNTESQQ